MKNFPVSQINYQLLGRLLGKCLIRFGSPVLLVEYVVVVSLQVFKLLPHSHLKKISGVWLLKFFVFIALLALNLLNSVPRVLNFLST